MSEPAAGRPHRAAIGGIGGSGTRLGAALLQMLGYYIGDDLNGPLDNLWFTLLFKRRSVLLECQSDFAELVAMFFARMSGETNFTVAQRERVLQLTECGRLQHEEGWLRERAETFLSGARSRNGSQSWGWKEPNTHIIIERLLDIDADLRYIHFLRHPIDMAFNRNQNQLVNWGPILLNRDVAIEPRQSLTYWCVAHRRISAVMRRWPERTMTVDFDELCSEPEQQGWRLASFLDARLPENFHVKIRSLIDPDRLARGRFETADLTQFAEDDVNYVRALGYAV